MAEMGVQNRNEDLVKRRSEQILSVARVIFAKNGYRRTTIDDIANALSVGKGTIYRYFKDKKSLFLAVFGQGIAQLHETFAQKVHPITDPPLKVETAVKTYFEFFDNNKDLIEIMMQVRSEFKEEHRRGFMTSYKDYIVRIQDNLRAGVEKGIFRDMDVEKTADAMSATLQGVLQSYYVRELEGDGEKQQGETLAEKAEAVTALILNGLIKNNEEQS